MARLFGTDGVRGVANKELTVELAMNLGKAGAYVLNKRKFAQGDYTCWVRYKNIGRYVS